MNKGTDEVCRLDRMLSMLLAVPRGDVKALIRQGRAAVNGRVCADAGEKPPIGSLIAVDGQVIDARTTRHVMLHKPLGVVTAARDASQPTVLSLLPPRYAALGCMPVGRLDKDTSGLLFLTTDGKLAHRLLSPARHVWKRYLAAVDGPLDEADARAFALGVQLSDFTALPAKLEILSSDSHAATALVTIREGKYHQVRRMFASRGRQVTSLARLSFGPIALDASLQPGEFRELTPDETAALTESTLGGGHA